MNKLFLIFFLSLVSLSASAQFGIGAQGAATYNLRNVSVGSKDYPLNPAPCFGFGINAFYNIHKGMFRIAVDADYMAVAKAIYPRPDSISNEILVSSFNISPEFQYAFKGNFDNKGQAWYVFAGVDMNIYNYQANVSNNYEYDAYGYPVLNPNTAMPVLANESFLKTYTAFTPNIGLGWQWSFNEHLSVFGQLKYSFGSKPAFNDIDQFGFAQESMPKSYNPSYFSLNIGIRFWPTQQLINSPTQ